MEKADIEFCAPTRLKYHILPALWAPPLPERRAGASSWYHKFGLYQKVVRSTRNGPERLDLTSLVKTPSSSIYHKDLVLVLLALARDPGLCEIR